MKEILLSFVAITVVMLFSLIPSRKKSDLEVSKEVLDDLKKKNN